MLKLPVIPQSALDVRPIEWMGLPRRFLNLGEAEVLVALMRSVNARRVLEIGCNEGRTAKLMLANVPSIERYVGIDVPPGYQFACAVQKNEVPKNPGHYAQEHKAFELVLRARGSLDLMPQDLVPGDAPKFDAVFIDGDHSRAAVVRDSVLADYVVRPGGMIIWHDYHDLGTVDVRDVLHERESPWGTLMEHVEGTWIVMQRVPNAALSGKPAASRGQTK